MADTNEPTKAVQIEPQPDKPVDWDRRWKAYQDHLAKYPDDKDQWRVFYSGCEAVASSLSSPTPARKIDGKFSAKYAVSGTQIVNTVSGEVIPEDEPLFLLRGRDHNALAAIHAYQGVCESECNELHMAGIQQVREKFCQFAANHPERMKQPGITRHLKLEAESKPILEVAQPEPTFMCVDCGVSRTEAEGAKIFTVCDPCWDKRLGREVASPQSEPEEEKDGCNSVPRQVAPINTFRSGDCDDSREVEELRETLRELLVVVSWNIIGDRRTKILLRASLLSQPSVPQEED